MIPLFALLYNRGLTKEKNYSILNIFPYFVLGFVGMIIFRNVGDLIFSTLDVARKLKLDPELILKNANNKFSKRWRRLEKFAKQENLYLNKISLKKYDLLWYKSK